MPLHLVFPRVNSVINTRRRPYSDNRVPCVCTYMFIVYVSHMYRARVHGISRHQ